MARIQPAVGLFVMIGLLYLFSADRRAVRWRIVVWGLLLQFVFAVFVLKTDAGQAVFRGANRGFLTIMKAAEEGGRFVFGTTGVTEHVPVGEREPDGTFHPTGRLYADTGFNFAFRVLPSIIFFSSLMALGYHIGVMQWVVRLFARIMAWSMKTSGAETVSAAANIFVGQTEAPLVVRPYVNRMTNSELMTVMAAGFANTAGGVMVMYVTLLQSRIPEIGAHLLTSSVLTGPAALMMAKLLMPETQTPLTAGQVNIDLPKTDANAIDAVARGAGEGLSLALNVAAMLIVFIAMVALIDAGLAWVSQSVFSAAAPWSLAMVFGKLFWPLAWLMGVPASECSAVGNLLGIKTFLNELVAYVQLSNTGHHLSDRAYLIASYALCGFANISSIGIQIGGIGAIAPERRGDLARVGVKAMIAGSFATFSAACIVAILI